MSTWQAAIRRWVTPYVAYGLLQGLQLAVLFKLAPRFFWFDDSHRQFGPMAWWLGRNRLNGRPPLMDPDLGMAGNLVADLQYGTLDPLHWIFQATIARFDNFIVISRVHAFVAVMLLGCGVLWLLLHYRVRPALAVAGAIGVASSGFFLWYGSSWWPLMWSTAWLPWLWVGMASRRWPGVLVAGVATWALLASGNPYAVPFGVLIVLGQMWELREESGSWRVLLGPHLAPRLVACVGGLIVALPTLLTALQNAPVMGRDQPFAEVGNSGFAVANLLDVVLGGTTLMGQTNTWNGNIGKAPALATFLVAVPLLALVSWGRAWRTPGVRTAMLVAVATAVSTQLPTTVGPFRFPIRYLVHLHVALPVLALVAASAAPDLSRRRIRLAAWIVLAQFTLAQFRAPAFFGWHVLALVLGAAALAAAAAVLRDRNPSAAATPTVLAPVVLAVCVVAAPLLGERMMVSVQKRFNRVYSLPDLGDRPFRVIGPGYAPGATVDEYRSQAYAVDRTMTVLVRGPFGEDMGWASGVTAGNTNLIAGLKPGFGSIAVWQSKLDERWCRFYEGDTCSTPEQLLELVEGTPVPWLEVLASDSFLLEKPTDPPIQRYLDLRWDRVAETDRWIEYRRRRPLPGRITVAQDVDVSSSGWTAGPARFGRPMETYVVSTGDVAGRLVFRTPYWPGLRATLDGRDLPVSTVDEAVLELEVPPRHRAAELEIFYDPVGARISTAATAGGLAVMLAAAVVPAGARRRRKAEAVEPAEERVA